MHRGHYGVTQWSQMTTTTTTSPKVDGPKHRDSRH